MNRPFLRWIATSLALSLAVSLGGCGVSGKKAGLAGAEAAGGGGGTGAAGETGSTNERKAGEAGAAAPEETSEEKPEKDETKKNEPKKETPAETAPNPAAAEEFKGLPKGEPEFILACRTLAAGGKATMTGKDDFVFDTRELGALGANSRTGTPRHQAMVAAIVAHAEKLRAAGVELVVAPVPAKPVVYPDFLGTDPVVKDRRHDSYLQALIGELEKAGVRVADSTKSLRSNRFDKNAASFPKTGLLWSPAAAATAARAVHTAARRTEAGKSIVRDKTIVSRDSAITQNGETFKARSVGWAQGDRLVPATVAKEGAPIVVVGDDHAAAHRTGGVNASVADQLSLVFGTAVDTQSAPGLGWKEAVAFAPAKDSPTKLVVWCFSAAQFLDAPAVSPKKPVSSASRRGSSRPAGVATPRLEPAAGTGLQLRDDPGLEGRPE